MIEAARLNIGNFKAKAGDGKLVLPELNMANSYLGKAEYALEKGKNFLGTVSEEAQQEVRHLMTLTDIALAIGSSKLERSRVEAEAALLSSRLEKVRSRVKVFDDYRSEIARLKAELAKSSGSAKELESLKAEKVSLQKQVDKLTAERELIAGQLEEARKAVPKEVPVKTPHPAVTEPMKPEVIMEIAPTTDK
jgi:DNA repair ATPase RecN